METNITPEQRERAARQKELALARRQQRLQQSSSARTRLDWSLIECNNVAKTGIDPINGDFTIAKPGAIQTQVCGPSTLNIFRPPRSTDLGMYQVLSENGMNKNPFEPGVSQNPSGSNIFNSPLKSDVSQYPSESNIYNSPLKSGASQNPSGSNIYNSPWKSGASQNPSGSNIYNSPLKSGTIQNPSGSNIYNSPLKSGTVQNPSGSNIYNSPLKSGVSQSGIQKNPSEERIYTPVKKICLSREDAVVVRNHGLENVVVRDRGLENDVVRNHGLENDVVRNHGLENVVVRDRGFENDVVRNHGLENDVVRNHGLENDVVRNHGLENEDGDNEQVRCTPSPSPIKFSKQQMQVLEAVACGKSVFMTGSAGTGKSFVLKYIIRILKKVYKEPQTVFVTASTGLAACVLGGTTLHSFAGIGLGNESPEKLFGKAFGRKDCRKRWISAKALIIDEISMIDGELFDKLDYVARKIRHTESCFGGIQLIVTGDFFQLPPVNPPNPSKYFAFQADCWNRCFDVQMELGYVFRQSDGQFVTMLNEIRKGVPSNATLENLKMCFRPLPDDGTGIAPTRLYPLKKDVREENLQNLRALWEDLITYTAEDLIHNPVYKHMVESMRSEKELQLCVGAQVMLIKNLDPAAGLVNGSKGVVVGFETVTDLTNESSDKEAWAYAHNVNKRGIWPVVRFESCTMKIFPEKETAEDGGYDVVSRVQLPLILAWALSVHKCQGMTLNKVETDLSKAFEYGMVYVALSRVKSLDGLRLTGFDPKSIKVHPDVVRFYERLSQGKL